LSDGKGVKKLAIELFDGYGYGSKLTEKEFGYGMNKKLTELAKRGIAGEPIAKTEIDAMRKYVDQFTKDRPWNGKAKNTPLEQSYQDLLTAIDKGLTNDAAVLAAEEEGKKRYRMSVLEGTGAYQPPSADAVIRSFGGQ